MKFSKIFLNIANKLLNFIVVSSLVIAVAFASYALWDNNLIYAAAENVQDSLLKLKPAEDSPSFEELLAINPDVKGWVTLDGTNIDHPILQGKTNLSYINTDVYGNFSLAGSVFLDSRNNGNFEDTYSLLYGHHMENSKMFGDLDLYKEERFFRENQTGKLILPDRIYKLEIFASLIVPSSEDSIFTPDRWRGGIDDLIKFTMKAPLYLNKDTIDRIMTSASEETQILALTTCSSEFTDARTVILAAMVPQHQ
ncbi:MAG TPA: class B sortase [Eubacteriaceae bacterium]|nr:class B sortase [Eubacteriaceae bacterium]